MKQQQRTARQSSARIPDHFPCHSCRHMVHVGDKVCGYCGKPQMIQCPACGRWAKWDHKVCTECAEPLQGGRTFTQNRELAKLKQRVVEKLEEYYEVDEHLEFLRDRRDRAIHRTVIVGVVFALLFALLLPLVAKLLPLAMLLSDWGTWGYLIVLVVGVVFLGPILTLIRLFVSLCRWGSLRELIAIFQDIAYDRATLASLREESGELNEAIAELEKLAAPKVAPAPAKAMPAPTTSAPIPVALVPAPSGMAVPATPAPDLLAKAVVPDDITVIPQPLPARKRSWKRAFQARWQRSMWWMKRWTKKILRLK